MINSQKFSAMRIIILLLIVHQTTIGISQSSQRVGPNKVRIEKLTTLDANEDAKTERVIWYCSGLSFSIFAIGAAYLMPTPPAPAKRLKQRTPAYVLLYTKKYKMKRKRIRLRQSFIGCMLGTGIVGLTVIAYISR